MMNAAIAAHGLGRNKDALRLGRQALKTEPHSEQLQRALGYLFFFMGKIEEAIAVMTQTLAPQDAASHYSLAIFHYKNDQPVECADELSRANAISPPQNMVERACIDIINGRLEKALEDLKQAAASHAVARRHVLRDPDLRILLDQRDFMMFDRG
jgi:tetratricopeptide (TPR) repeat protein